MGSSSNHMACLLKIESSSSGWEKSFEKLLSNYGLKFVIDPENKMIYINGKIDPEMILQKLKKAGKKAKIVWSKCGRPENRKDDHFMEQSYAMNALHSRSFNHHPNQGNPMGPYMNGFANYYPNQGYYPQQPPPHLMNMPFQPHFPPFGHPVPYPRQVHPQPKPPPPYQSIQTEPKPKLFPPTPAPPKNFAMGDLQVGCIIM